MLIDMPKNPLASGQWQVVVRFMLAIDTQYLNYSKPSIQVPQALIYRHIKDIQDITIPSARRIAHVRSIQDLCL